MIAILVPAARMLATGLGLAALVPLSLSAQGPLTLASQQVEGVGARPPVPLVGASAVAEPGGNPGFVERQMAYPRVQRAAARRSFQVESLLDERGVDRLEEVLFRVFKREQELEVWGRDAGEERFTLVQVYPICAVSGRLGPKRRQGDLQIPEGFYTLDLFNPRSKYHLSMRVDYPNPVDRTRSARARLGGDIYIHGGCATVGCVPVTDQWIEELYLIALEAREAGQQRIPVHIFPTHLTEDGMRWLGRTYGHDFVDYDFWRNLQPGYLALERTGRVPEIGYDGGRYTFQATATALIAPPLTFALP